MSLKKYSGIVCLIFAAYLFYSRSYVLAEYFDGRPNDQLDFSVLILPLIVLFTAVYFFLSKSKKIERND